MHFEPVMFVFSHALVTTHIAKPSDVWTSAYQTCLVWSGCIVKGPFSEALPPFENDTPGGRAQKDLLELQSRHPCLDLQLLIDLGYIDMCVALVCSMFQ